MGWFWSEVGSLVIIVEEVGPKWWWSLRVLEVVVLAGLEVVVLAGLEVGPKWWWSWRVWKWWSLRVLEVVVLAGLGWVQSGGGPGGFEVSPK